MEKLARVKEEMVDYFRKIYDPEIPVNIYDLGLFYKLEVSEVQGRIQAVIDMTLTAPTCPVADSLIDQVSQVDKVVEDLDYVEVNLVFDPPWNQENMTYEARLELGLL